MRCVVVFSQVYHNPMSATLHRNSLAIWLTNLVIILVAIARRSVLADTNQTSGVVDGPAELPMVHVKSSLADTPAPGKVRNVKASDDLQRAFNDAACGDTLKLEAGAVFSGHFMLPAKSCDDAHWIVLRTSAPDSA